MHYGKHNFLHFRRLPYLDYLKNGSIENYLDIKNRNLMVSFTKFRLSDHCLMIEMGRNKRPTIPREQRFCPTWPTLVENEVHFLTQCSAYANRNDRFAAIENEVINFVNIYVQAPLIFVMSQENEILNYRIISTVHEWLSVRGEKDSG